MWYFRAKSFTKFCPVCSVGEINLLDEVVEQEVDAVLVEVGQLRVALEQRHAARVRRRRVHGRAHALHTTKQHLGCISTIDVRGCVEINV